MQFDPCFPPDKLARVLPLVPATLAAMGAVWAAKYKVPFMRPWPARVTCMAPREIRAGRKHGKGHGLYVPGAPAVVRLNKRMGWRGLYLNLIHELWHHQVPGLTDKEINDHWVPAVYKAVLGRRLAKGSWAQWRGTNPCSK